MDVYQISEAERCDTSAPRQRHISGKRTGSATSGWNSSSPWVTWKKTWSRHIPTWQRENPTWTREIPTCQPGNSDVAFHVSSCLRFLSFPPHVSLDVSWDITVFQKTFAHRRGRVVRELCDDIYCVVRMVFADIPMSRTTFRTWHVHVRLDVWVPYASNIADVLRDVAMQSC